MSATIPPAVDERLVADFYSALARLLASAAANVQTAKRPGKMQAPDVSKALGRVTDGVGVSLH